jgi:hypothetical protein
MLMSGLFDCSACRDTGAVVLRDDRAPYAATPSYRASGAYCSCSFGDALRVRDRNFEAQMKAENAAAREWADAHMSPPQLEDHA